MSKRILMKHQGSQSSFGNVYIKLAQPNKNIENTENINKNFSLKFHLLEIQVNHLWNS